MFPRSFQLGLAANLLFWPLLFAMAAMRPDYSHLHRAVSELGSFDAPNRWLWNIGGYFLPGLLIGMAGWRIGRGVGGRWALPLLLSLGGLMMAWAGVFPADMQHRDGLLTRLHLLGAFGSLIAWLLALLLLCLKLRGPWRPASWVALACLAALAAALVFSDPDAPGLTQRWMFAIFLASYPVLARLHPR